MHVSVNVGSLLISGVTMPFWPGSGEEGESWVCGGSWVREICAKLWLKWGFLRRVLKWELVLGFQHLCCEKPRGQKIPRDRWSEVCGSEQWQPNDHYVRTVQNAEIQN